MTAVFWDSDFLNKIIFLFNKEALNESKVTVNTFIYFFYIFNCHIKQLAYYIFEESCDTGYSWLEKWLLKIRFGHHFATTC